MTRADEIIAMARMLSGEANGGSTDDALAYLLAADSDDVIKLLRDAIDVSRGRHAEALARGYAHARSDIGRDLAMLQTGLELGVAAERTRHRVSA